MNEQPTTIRSSHYTSFNPLANTSTTRKQHEIAICVCVCVLVCLYIYTSWCFFLFLFFFVEHLRFDDQWLLIGKKPMSQRESNVMNKPFHLYHPFDSIQRLLIPTQLRWKNMPTHHNHPTVHKDGQVFNDSR